MNWVAFREHGIYNSQGWMNCIIPMYGYESLGEIFWSPKFVNVGQERIRLLTPSCNVYEYNIWILNFSQQMREHKNHREAVSFANRKAAVILSLF